MHLYPVAVGMYKVKSHIDCHVYVVYYKNKCILQLTDRLLDMMKIHAGSNILIPVRHGKTLYGVFIRCFGRNPIMLYIKFYTGLFEHMADKLGAVITSDDRMTVSFK